MNKFFVILLLFFLFLPKSFANEAPGLNNIGFAAFNITAEDFNCSGFLKALAPLKTIHISFLYNTFGNNFSCLKKILKDPRLDTLEIHLINEPGHRNKRLGNYEFLYKIGSEFKYDRLLKANNQELKNKFVNYVKPLQKILNENLQPHTNLIINPGLESNVSDRAGKTLVSWSRQMFPNTRIVWNPINPAPNRRAKTRADIIEGHNLDPNINEPCIYNLDGTDVSYDNRPALGEENHKEGDSKNWVQSGAPLFQLLETFANECEIAYIWTAESNGIDRNSSDFVDPRKRPHNIPRTMYSKIFEDILSLNEHGQIYPQKFEYSDSDNFILNSCEIVKNKFVDMKKSGRLMKQSEFRNRGGVILLPKNYSSVKEIVLMKGKKIIDVYKNLNRYKDGRIMFRSKKSPTTYPFKTYLVFTHQNKKNCFKIPNPRIRLD